MYHISDKCINNIEKNDNEENNNEINIDTTNNVSKITLDHNEETIYHR